MQVERQQDIACYVAGEWRTGEDRVRICPLVGDSLWKHRVIPHEAFRGKSFRAPEDELASYQLVGKVMAYQGNDG